MTTIEIALYAVAALCACICAAGWARRARRDGNRWVAADAAKGG
jgi:hypothetical protein